MEDLLGNLALGFATALSAQNLLLCFIGCLVGTLIGVLPGVGPIATIAMLLPLTFKLEPASAISVAGLLERSEAGVIPAGATVVLTVTGHGLKDPQWALRTADGSDVQPTVVPVDTTAIADVLGLAPAGQTSAAEATA